MNNEREPTTDEWAAAVVNSGAFDSWRNLEENVHGSDDPFKRLAPKVFSFVILMCLSLVSITATVAVCWKLAKWAME